MARTRTNLTTRRANDIALTAFCLWWKETKGIMERHPTGSPVLFKGQTRERYIWRAVDQVMGDNFSGFGRSASARLDGLAKAVALRQFKAILQAGNAEDREALDHFLEVTA